MMAPELEREAIGWLRHYEELARSEGELGTFDALGAILEELATLRDDLARVTEERSHAIAAALESSKRADAVDAALAAERERCAGIADSYEEREDVDTPTAIGAAIRAQPTPTTEARDA